jgi:hypothetical protein
MAEPSPIVIPANALRDGSVFIVEAGKAKRRTVTKGRTTSGGDVEIKSGLNGGETLILMPPSTLKDGDRVTAESAK